MAVSEKTKTCLSLFISFFRISLFTLGGGAVMLPLMEDEFVRKKKLLTESEMLDVISITNSLPGVIAINSSVLIGHMTAGLPGALFSVFGVLLPPFFIILMLAELLLRLKQAPWIDVFFRGIRAGVTALLLAVFARFGRKNLRHAAEILLAAGAFLAVRVFQVNAVLVLLAGGILGYFVFRSKNGDEQL